MIPLWEHVVTLFENNLNVSHGAFDALLLADMYKKQFQGLYQDELRGCLPNADIVPGQPHRQLFRVKNLAAVITTNQLDTLLDFTTTEGPIPEERWHPVIQDEDLASSLAESRIQLLYIHGHRSSHTTWVFSKEDYDDIAAKKPVMMARVRQLMGQHPVLFVGFGLTDPNFHSLVRSVVTDLGGSAPLALAVMIHRPPKAFVDYWRTMGINISALKPQQDPASAFVELFKLISRNFARTPLDANSTYVTEMEEWVSTRPSMALATAAFADWTVRRYDDVLAFRQEPLYQRETLSNIWLKIPLVELGSEAGTKFEEIIMSASRLSRNSYSDESWSQLPEDFKIGIPNDNPKFVYIEHGRFLRGKLLPEIIEHRLKTRGWASSSDVLRWLNAWLDWASRLPIILDYSHFHLSDFLDVCSYCWKNMARDESEKTRARWIVQRCAELAQRYKLACLPNVEKDALSFDGLASSAPFLSYLPEFLDFMHRAMEHHLDLDRIHARKCYLDAADLVAKHSDYWLEYLAMSGAYETFSRDDISSETGRMSTERLDSLKAETSVMQWLERGNDLERRVLGHMVNESDQSERDSNASTKSVSFSSIGSAVRAYWNELTAYQAPLSLRRNAIARFRGMMFDNWAEEIVCRIAWEVQEKEGDLKNIILDRFNHIDEQKNPSAAATLSAVSDFVFAEKSTSATGVLTKIRVAGLGRCFVKRNHMQMCLDLLRGAIHTYGMEHQQETARYSSIDAPHGFQQAVLSAIDVAAGDDLVSFIELFAKIAEHRKFHKFHLASSGIEWRRIAVIAPPNVVETLLDIVADSVVDPKEIMLDWFDSFHGLDRVQAHLLVKLRDLSNQHDPDIAVLALCNEDWRQHLNHTLGGLDVNAAFAMKIDVLTQLWRMGSNSARDTTSIMEQIEEAITEGVQNEMLVQQLSTDSRESWNAIGLSLAFGDAGKRVMSEIERLIDAQTDVSNLFPLAVGMVEGGIPGHQATLNFGEKYLAR